MRGAWEASFAEDWPAVLATLDRRDAIVYRIENGLIVYQAYFNDQNEALEKARSGEQPDD